jgi:hypothetical protein
LKTVAEFSEKFFAFFAFFVRHFRRFEKIKGARERRDIGRQSRTVVFVIALGENFQNRRRQTVTRSAKPARNFSGRFFERVFRALKFLDEFLF